ncbi:hypothetical protein ACRCRK_21610, partial [Pseudomonas aeruginosa]
MDLQIDDFHKDAAGGLLLLYQAFPRKTALYVEDLIGREPPDEFGLPSKRHQSCLGALLWLAEEGYLRFANTIHYEALDQAVLSEKAFLRLTRIVPRAGGGGGGGAAGPAGPPPPPPPPPPPAPGPAVRKSEMPALDSLKTLRSLAVDGKTYHYYSLP